MWQKIRLAAYTILGMSVPLIVLIAYYSARGAGTALVDALFVYPARYASIGLGRTPGGLIAESVGWTYWLLPLPHTILMVAGFVWGLYARKAETLRWLAFFGASWACVIIQGRFFPYHHLPMVPALAWGGGLLLSAAPTNPETTERRAPLNTTILVVGGGLLAFVLVQYFWWNVPYAKRVGHLATFESDNGIPDEKGEWMGQREIARRIRKLTAPDDRIFIWGDEPLVYTLADRPMAGSNCHLMQIVPPWGGVDRLHHAIARLARERPKLILVCPEKLWWRQNKTPTDLLALYPDMQRFLSDLYTKGDDWSGYELWMRSD